MRSALIIGSGPAAAGVAIALQNVADLEITVVDIGHQLEAGRRATVETLSTRAPSEWDPADLSKVTAQPAHVRSRGLPQKRSFGSDFPFTNMGQLDGVTTTSESNTDVISGAYGGFSNVWGAQVMPFPASVTREWPISTLEPHYRAILAQIPYAAEEDDLEAQFPLLAGPQPLPPLAPRTANVLARYERHRARLHRWGLTLGRARLALDGRACVRVGLCLTGCPYGLVYSASHTFDRLRASGRIRYVGGQLAVQLAEDEQGASVLVRDLESGSMHRIQADRIFVACGGIGSTRLVMGSLGMHDEEVKMAESQQFVIPMLSLRPTPDPRPNREFTLNQFNMTFAGPGDARDLAQLHFYTYNPAFDDALPAPLRAAALRLQALRRVTVAIGYLPSWRSPRLTIRTRPPESADQLPAITISGEPMPREGRRMLRRTLAQSLRAGPLLDLYPAWPFVEISPPAKSYHFGSSFPHHSTPSSLTTSDAVGRVGGWRRIHITDGAVLPNVAATTFTLTVMANAHRIATETLALP